MKTIRRAKEVRQALRASDVAVKEALKELNLTAGALMSKGDYSGAEALASKGLQIQKFRGQLQELTEQWKKIQSSGHRKGDSDGTSTPLWQYFQPILKALVEAGGEAQRSELELLVSQYLEPTMKPGDEDPLARGRIRWQVMVRRARKPMVAEGWLEPGAGKIWRVTEKGRRAASHDLTSRKKSADTRGAK